MKPSTIYGWMLAAFGLVYSLSPHFALACVEPSQLSPSEAAELSGLLITDPLYYQQKFQQSSLNSRSLDSGQSIGFFSEGRLQNPSVLPLSAPGFVKLFRSRDRGYLNSELRSMVLGLGATLKAKLPNFERLQVGDASQSTGGYISGHGSHQNGLDVDFVYLRNNHREQDLNYEVTFKESFVRNGVVTSNFATDANFKLMQWAVAKGNVNRIFVDPKIKKRFCQYARRIGTIKNPLIVETLRRLRPIAAHDDHFHLRIKCPQNSPSCLDQEEPPLGTSCSEVGG